MTKLKLDKECSKKIPDKNKIIEFLNNKTYPDETTISFLLMNKILDYEGMINLIKDILNVFFHFGYKYTKNDIIILAKSEIELNKNMISDDYWNDEQFKKELIDICDENNNYFYGLNASINGFKKFLLSSKYNIANYKSSAPPKCPNLTNVKFFIRKYNITPDLECLKIVLGLPLSQDIVKYFIEEHYIEPDFDCISSCYKADKNIKFIAEYLKNKYNN